MLVGGSLADNARATDGFTCKTKRAPLTLSRLQSAVSNYQLGHTSYTSATTSFAATLRIWSKASRRLRTKAIFKLDSRRKSLVGQSRTIAICGPGAVRLKVTE